ncbi:class A beta-lactamase [Dyella psychrodurans]|uniref:Beta-lactamase n=1 Tax=Dyella psychrodurans TaxID=1927960 RepID=A0A370WVG4_9GAMM|nr:class A beta-lactamase [Dyella psychrodurans]RDS80041.1 class A beta-lactamase [Dyella psychrodurans]
MNRRNLLKGALIGVSALALNPVAAFAAEADDVRAKLAALERKHGGRLGVAVLDTGSGRSVGHRADERFMMCSTFKMLLAAATLDRVDRGAEQLDRHLIFGKDAVLSYAPVTQHHVGLPGMSIADLCKAAVSLSDNTAANVLLANLGGPAAVTAYARQLGDTMTRLDRNEPELNRPSPDHVSDTTTPASMLNNLRTLVLGHVLRDESRKLLTEWLRETTTGKNRLQAGLPAGWVTGDKTGSGYDATNDVAIMWPPQRKPLLVSAYYSAANLDDDARSAVLADVGRIVATM